MAIYGIDGLIPVFGPVLDGEDLILATQSLEAEIAAVQAVIGVWVNTPAPTFDHRFFQVYTGAGGTLAQGDHDVDGHLYRAVLGGGSRQTLFHGRQVVQAPTAGDWSATTGSTGKITLPRDIGGAVNLFAVFGASRTGVVILCTGEENSNTPVDVVVVEESFTTNPPYFRVSVRGRSFGVATNVTVNFRVYEEIL
jgi:hypothetical protein